MTIFFLRKDLWYWPAVYAALLVICHAQSFPVSAQPAKPILVSVPTSTRAVALDAVNLAPEPFYARPVSLLYGPDEPTRIILFVLNLSLKPGQDASALRADAEDAAHRHYNLEVEYVGKIFGQDWLSQVNLRLDGGMGDLGDVLVGITYEGVTSNRVRVAIGHVGGGPEDDAGAAPTPAPPYTISGRITSGATGLRGVSVLLGGTQTATVTTGDDGSYLFTVTTVGNYTITPFKEQDFYQFSPPSQSFNALSNNQFTNFTAALVIASPTHVLEFDGTQMSVDYGVFWPHDTTVGNFFWEFWAMPGENTQGRYILSDGYGGAHTLLFGFNHGPRGYNLFGNIWNGTGTIYFGSDEGPSVGEWGHYAVGWDGKNIITYYNGVPVGKTPFGGPRVSLGTGHGSTMLLIGGSNHQNLIGRIAQVRGYEENNPRESSPESSFAPQTVFSVEGQLLSYYFRPAERVADLSNGYNGGPHSGWPRGMKEFYFNYSCPGCPIPKFVIDPTAPDFSNQSNPGKVKTLIVLPPPPTPGGARIFDSFSRDNATYILAGKGGLGTTEAGTAGSKTWQSNLSAAQPQPFGILGGRAVLLGDDAALAWVSAGSNANLNLSVERAVGAYGSGVNTGLSFRVVDKNNFFFAYTTDDKANSAAPKRLPLGYYLSGTKTVIADDVAMPQGSWKTLRVVTMQAGSINVFADDALVHSTNSAVHGFATGAGLFNHGSGTGLSNRWDNFTILDVP